ncbi:MAG: stalk domain-containing protein [Clostridia bacterium]
MKRAVSLLVSLIMLLSVVPILAQAEDAYDLITDYVPQAVTIYENLSYTDEEGSVHEGTIMHPGISVNQMYLDNMRDKVRSGQEPWRSAFVAFAADGDCSKNPRIYYEFGNDYFVNILGPWTKQNNQALDVYCGMRANWDGATAFKQAIMWYITGDDVYRANSMKIIRAWSSIESVQWHVNFRYAILTYFLAAAGEIFRYTDCETEELKWTEEDTKNLANMMEQLSITYNMHTFWMAQHQFCVMGGMAQAIFTNDLKMYEEAVEAALVNEEGDEGGRNGALTKVMRLMTKNEETGEELSEEDYHVQLTEMGRDAGHSYDDIGGLSTLLQMIFAQGTMVDPVKGTVSVGEDAVNPFNFGNDRFLEGYSYLVRYHMGEDVLWTPTVQDGYTYTKINEDGRGRIEALAGAVYNYYKYIEKQNMTEDRFKYLASVYESNMPEPTSDDYPAASTLLLTLGEGEEVTPSVNVNGIKIKTDVAPFILNDRVLVPLRAIFESIGASIEWNQDTKTVTAVKGDKVIELTIDNLEAKVNGEIVTLDTPAIIRNNRTMVPVRFVSEALGAEVKWNKYLKIASVVTEPVIKDDPILKFDFENNVNCTNSGIKGFFMGTEKYTLGHDNMGVDLNGKGSFVSLDTGITEYLSDCTISAWINLREVKGWQRVFDFGSNTSSYMFLTPQSSDGTVKFATKTLATGKEQEILTNTVIESNKWYHIAVTLSGDTGIIYINGEEAGRSETITSNPSDLGFTSANYIGKSQWNDPYFDGIIDDFRVYNRALTADEIKDLY